MKKINEAYDVLSSVEKREAYDVEYRLNNAKKSENNSPSGANTYKVRRERTSYTGYSQNESGSTGPKGESQSHNKTYYKSPEWKTNGYRPNQWSTRSDATKQENIPRDKSYWDKLRRFYREVRKDEKRNSFSKRHRKVTEDLKDSFIWGNNSIKDRIILYTTIGTFNIFYEFFYQFSKLGKIGSDPFPKFVIRNRRLAGTVLAGTILFSCLGNNASAKQTESPIIENTESIIEVDSEETSVVKLYRNHKIEYGDSLWTLATNANTSVDELQRLNNLSDSRIYEGDTLKIIYKISEDDIDYYTEAIEVKGKSLSEIASLYETNIETLLVLNPEGIEKTSEGYLILSDTLVVPKFISKAEYDLIQRNKIYD